MPRRAHLPVAAFGLAEPAPALFGVAPCLGELGAELQELRRNPAPDDALRQLRRAVELRFDLGGPRRAPSEQQTQSPSVAGLGLELPGPAFERQ